MKTEISVSCFEDKLRESVSECLAIMNVCDRITLDLKVKFYLEPTPGHKNSAHRYITIHKDSRVDDVIEIYELKKKLNPEGYFTNS